MSRTKIHVVFYACIAVVTDACHMHSSQQIHSVSRSNAETNEKTDRRDAAPSQQSSISTCSALFYFDKKAPPYQEDYLWDKVKGAWLLISISYDTDADWLLDHEFVVYGKSKQDYSKSPRQKVLVGTRENTLRDRRLLLDSSGHKKLFRVPKPEHKSNELIRKSKEYQAILDMIGVPKK